MSWFHVDEKGVIPKKWFDEIPRPVERNPHMAEFSIPSPFCVKVLSGLYWRGESRRRILEGLD